MIMLPNLRLGGAERVVVNLLKYIDRSQFQVELVIIDGRDSELLDEVPSDVKIVDLRCRRLRYALPFLLMRVVRSRPDVLFLNMSYVNLAFAMLRWVIPRSTRLVARETNILSKNNRHYRFQRLWDWLFSVFYKNMDAIITQSRAMQDDLVTRYKIPLSKTVMIRNPVDTDALHAAAGNGHSLFEKTEGVRDLIFLGRLYAEKRVDLAIRAIHRMPGENLRLHILGDGPERDGLTSLVTELDLCDQVRFWGVIKDPFATLCAADALMLPSENEGLPNVVLEARVLGVPVIASPAGGVVMEILENDTACEVATDDSADAFFGAVKRWIDRSRPDAHPSPQQSSSKRMQATAMSFSASKVVPHFEAVFR